MSTIEPNIVLATIAALLSLAVGAFVFFRGRSRRIGNIPHCPKCDYILHGNDSAICPECGTAFTVATIVYGERPRRIGTAVTGALLMLIALGIGGLVGSGIVSKIEWYHYRPFGWVMDDLDSTNPTIVSRAWPDVESALDHGQLSDVELDLLVEHGLRAQLASSLLNYHERVLELVAERYAAHKLSASQQDRLFTACTALALKTRPRVGPEDVVPYRIEALGRGPRGWWRRTDTLGTSVEDHPMRDGGGGSSGSISIGSIGSTIPRQPIGMHQLKVKVEVTIFSGDFSNPATQSTLYKVTRTLAMSFEVLPDAIPIKFLNAPDAAVISRCISAEPFRFSDRELAGTIMVREPPANVAFDVFVLLNGKEYPMGALAAAKGYGGGFGMFCQHLPAERFSTFDIVLRSSEVAAKSTLDLTEIWKGEIVIKDVAVQPPGKR